MSRPVCPFRICLALAAVLFLTGAASADVGVVEGSLVHKDSGEPVIGAPVKLDGTRYAVTNEAGVFVFPSVSAGAHELTVDDPECAVFTTTIEVQAGQHLRLRYALDRRGTQDVEEVVIRAERLKQEVSDTVLQMEEVKKIPGTQGDILKIIQSLPGVARMTPVGGGAALGVVVRGAAPEDSVVLIDDHPVPLLYHFGNLKSILNSDMLKRIDFLPGGFGAEYGRAIGGVVDVQTLPCGHERYDGYLELSMLDAGFFVQGPIGKNAGFVAAARRSTLDAWLPFVLENLEGFELTMAPVYYDYQAKLDWSPTPDDRLSLLAFGSSDEMKWLFEKPISADPSIRGDFGFKTHFHRLYLSWTRAPQATAWQFKLSLVGGFDEFNGEGGNFLIVSSVPSLNLRADVQWQISKRWKLAAGLVAGLANFDLRYSMVRPPQEGTVPNKFNTLEMIIGQEQWLAINYAAYASLSLEPVDGMLITGGVRFDGYAFGEHGDWAIMPRLALKKEIRPGTIFKAGVGLYQQAAPEFELSAGFGNPDLRMERAIHYAVGVEQRLPFHVSLDVTAFYKDIDRLVVSDPERIYSNQGIGEISGLEFLLRRDLSDGLFGWIAYTLMRSRRKDGPDEPWRLFSFDQTHILTLVAGYQLPTSERRPNHGLRSGWEFGLRFQLVTGSPYTPIIGGIFDADYDNYLPIPGPINSERPPLYHRLDARVDYTWAFEAWALSVFLDVQNVYNYRAILRIDYNHDYTETAHLRDLPIIPALGIRGSF